MMKAIGVLATVMLINAASANCQSVARQSLGVRSNEAFDKALKRLDTRTRVRVSDGHTMTEGMFGAYNDESVVITTDAGNQVPIRFNAIDGMWKRSASTGVGALIGAGLGGLALGSLGVAFVNGMCESSNGCSSDAVNAGIVGGAIGALGGSVIGAGIGFLVKRWVRIDPSP